MAYCSMSLVAARTPTRGNWQPRSEPCPRSFTEVVNIRLEQSREETYLEELCTHVPPSRRRVPAAAEGPPEVASWFSSATTRASA